jgi:hypothetical protein
VPHHRLPENTALPPPKVTYHIACYTAAQMAKPKTKREPKSAYLHLSSAKPWDTIQAQLLVKISSIFQLDQIQYSNYDLTFTVLWFPKDPLPLLSADDYSFMIECPIKAKDPVANIKIVGNTAAAEQVTEYTHILAIDSDTDELWLSKAKWKELPEDAEEAPVAKKTKVCTPTTI